MNVCLQIGSALRCEAVDIATLFTRSLKGNAAIKVRCNSVNFASWLAFLDCSALVIYHAHGVPSRYDCNESQLRLYSIKTMIERVWRDIGQPNDPICRRKWEKVGPEE